MCVRLLMFFFVCLFFFFKQKTAYEMRISDWSSDVCSSDLSATSATAVSPAKIVKPGAKLPVHCFAKPSEEARRSEEHTSELQSLMRISYAVFCLKKKKTSER